MLDIFRFGKPVGEKEKHVARNKVCLLRDINHILNHAQRQIGLGRQNIGFLADDKGTIVSRVAVAQLARRQIEHTDEKCDEHVRLIALRNIFVQRAHDTVRTALMGRNRAEKRVDHPHNQCGRNPFATHIADAEIEFLVADEIVVQVAAYHLGGDERSTNVDIIAFSFRFGFRQHVHLDFSGDIQLAFNVFLFHVGPLEVADAFGGPMDDEGEDKQTRQSQQQVSPSHSYQRLKHFVVIIDNCNSPGFYVFGRTIKNVAFRIVFIVGKRKEHGIS